ncbi:Protein transport protein S9 plasma membrane t-SNARE [Tulasnella sp. 418]|nr:Protein transport protein S9 plasma membrane t-SNARE [Tulasnella sp. 418]
MSFFRRKDSPQIPPSSSGRQSDSSSIASSRQGPPSYRSNASTYVPSRDGDPYNRPSPQSYQTSSGDQKYQSNSDDPYARNERDRFQRNNPIGDSYSRTGRNADADRNELFSGYNPEKSSGRNRFDDRDDFTGGSGRSRWQDRQPQNQEEEEEDIETIKKDTRVLKNESLSSTRNALRIAQEAEETARNTLMKLGDQSEKLANVERHLDSAKGHTNRAEDRTNEIKQLNKSIFRPVIVFNKDAKRQREEDRLNSRYAAEQEERERTALEVRESQNRVGRAATYGRSQGEDTYGEEQPAGGFGRRNLTQAQQNARVQNRSRFQFEKTASDDELEDELDDNLDEIHDVTKRLRALAAAQGQELDTQNRRLDRLNDNAGKLDLKLNNATNRLKKL